MTQNNNQKEDVDWENLFNEDNLYVDHTMIYGWFNMSPIEQSDAMWKALASRANQILKERIEKYGRKVLLDETYWSFTSDAHFKRKATMEATLINIRKIDE